MNCAVHLDRAAAAPCDRCGTFSCDECLSLFGTQRLCGSCRARSAQFEWDRRKELGLFRAWWLTCRRLIVSPVQTLEVISPDGSVLESTIFAGLSTLAGFLPTMILYAGFAVAMMTFGPMLGENKLGLAAGGGIGVFVFCFYLAMMLSMTIVYVLVSAGLELVVLRLAGRPEASYSVAVRAHALSMAPYVIGVVPLCSMYVFPIWALVLRAIAIGKLHRTTAGVGVASALIPLVLCCGMVGGLYAMLFAAGMMIGKS